MAVEDASVNSSKGLVKSGAARMGAEHRHDLRSSNACWHSGVQVSAVHFPLPLSKFESGRALLAKSPK